MKIPLEYNLSDATQRIYEETLRDKDDTNKAYVNEMLPGQTSKSQILLRKIEDNREKQKLQEIGTNQSSDLTDNGKERVSGVTIV